MINRWFLSVCYNSEEHIKETIKSVLNQTYANIQYIVVDGDSTDDTLKIVKNYEPKFNDRMIWISESDDGIYQAMNKGIRWSEGSFLFFLNSGDYFAGDQIIEEMISLAQQGSADFIYGDVMLNEKPPERQRQKVVTKYQLLFRTICHQSILAHRSCFRDRDFDENLNWLSDYKWILQCFWDSDIKYLWMDKPVVFFDPVNRTGLSDRTLKCERLEERKKIGTSLFSFPVNLLFGLNQIRLKAKFRCWGDFEG